jgi:hypothetical protein
MSMPQSRTWRFVVDEQFADCSFAWSRHPKGYLQRTTRSSGARATLLMHKFVWFLAYRQWPDQRIDHINGIKWDNRISNLRLMTHSGNLLNRNSAKTRRNRLPMGVKKRNDRYVATVRCEGTEYWIGTFDTPSEASAAYQKAKTELIAKEEAKCSTARPTRQA